MTAKDTKGKKSLQEVLQTLEKQYGQGSVMKLAKGENIMRGEVIPTGVYSIDKALGGGVLRGRIVEFYGSEASGKTTLALQVIASAQSSGNKAAYIDVEHAFNMEYARALGVDIENLFFSQPSNAEEAFDVARMLAATGEFAIIVVDSVAALVPAADLEGQVGKAQIGSLARFMSSSLKQMLATFSETKTTLLFINQIRMNVGVMFGNPETTTGGQALKFYASQRVEIKRSTKVEDKDGNIVGYNTKIKVIKNKAAIPNQKTDVTLLHGKGFDKGTDLFNSAVKLGIIEKKAATYYLGDTKLAVGEMAAKTRISEDSELQKEMMSKLDKFEIKGEVYTVETPDEPETETE